MTVTFQARPVALSSAALMAAPLVAMVAASCDGLNARTPGRSNEPMRGPALVVAAAPVDVGVVAGPPQAAITRPAASAPPSGPRNVNRMSPLLQILEASL